MLTLSGYEITERINKGTRSLIYRARCLSDGRSVTLKTLAAQYPSLSEIATLKHEYEILSELAIPGVVKALEWRAQMPSPVLVLENIQGQNLHQLLQQQGSLSLETFFPLAITLADILGQVHDARLIHRDIKPSNILITAESDECKLIDFGLASRLPQSSVTAKDRLISGRIETDNDDFANPSIADGPVNHALVGTYAYLSPEQTGRMNRKVDFRADLYSLGVVFYEMLCGQRPFQADDTLGWVHSHIAKTPPPLQSLNSSIPDVLAEIVEKLLSKMAEDRYQHAQGLKADLETCQAKLRSTGKIQAFSIGDRDRLGQFQLPQTLYGRSAEIETLLTTFDRVSQAGTAELMLVSGYSGIGKSALVHEIHRPMVRQRGYFITGKFDQFRRNVPYESVIRAFQDLVRQLLSQSESAVLQWKQQLVEALAPNAQVLIEVIPDLELILGSQPDVPDLSPSESRTRFNQTFQKMVEVFAQPSHPLVIFLDDLQWVDGASLELFKELLTQSDSRYLLVIGAYRDNEVGPEHPLMLNLDQLRQAGVVNTQIPLQPLTVKHVLQLVADTLNLQPSQVQPLGQLLFEKTLGNAFFTRMLLKSLHHRGQLTFDFIEFSWRWDIDQLRALSLTDNVVELMTGRIDDLPESTQHLLNLAACIGDRFDLAVLSTVAESAAAIAARGLWPAIEAGLILPLGEDYRIPMLLDTEADESLEIAQALSNQSAQIRYKFAHDRIQEAAYAQLPLAKQQQTHWRIGQLRWQHDPDLLEDDIFEIVSHLNRGYIGSQQNKSPEPNPEPNQASLNTLDQQLEQLIHLNWQAGSKAKTANAYETALTYFAKGLALLTEGFAENPWQTHYRLCFSLHRDLAECEYLCNHFERAEALFEVALDQAQSALDQAEIDIIRIVLYDNQGKFIENLTVGGQALRRLGLVWPSAPTEIADILAAEMAVYKQQLQATQLPQLADMAEMSDPTALASMQLLVNMTGPAYFTDPQLVTLVTLKMALLSMQYGISKWASQGYTFWGVMVIAALRDYETAYQFGQVALQLNERYQHYNEVKVLNSYVGHILPWHSHLQTGIPLLRRAYQVGSTTGDVFTCYAVVHLSLHLFLVGNELSEVSQEITRYLAYVRQRENVVLAQQLQVYLLIIYSLQLGELTTPQPGLEDFDEDQCVQLFQQNQYGYGLGSLTALKGMHAFISGQYEQAVSCFQETEQHLPFMASTAAEAEHIFFYALTLAALYERADSQTQTTYWDKIQDCVDNLKTWAKHCPSSYQHKVYLVTAEMARLSNQPNEAIEAYDQAIAENQAQGYVHYGAIAHELAGQFWLARGNPNIARSYLQTAHYSYQRWGAEAKAHDLWNNYLEILEPLRKRQEFKSTLSDPSSSSSSRSNQLDLSTVMKASQAIAGEIRLESLVQTLMEIVIENAGAQRGVLLLKKDETWSVAAIGNIEDRNLESKNIGNQHESGPEERSDIPQFERQGRVQSSQLPPLAKAVPTTVMNYVIRTQSPVLIEDSAASTEFLQDPYWAEYQPKSILCSPIASQGQIMGLLYLENDLASGTFSAERLQVLTMLSAQIAISLTNAQLYEDMADLNQALEEANLTLEQRVAARTQELTQTLDVLKATQAELVIENALLRSDHAPTDYTYQVGGALAIDAPTYVVRQADRQLYKALQQAQYCYIFNARQMGKSSLRVQMFKRMQTHGVACVAIDLSVIGSYQTTQEQWYIGFMFTLARSLELHRKVDILAWWKEHSLLSPLQRLDEFLTQVVLTHISDKIIVFLDEVDSLMSLSFEADDFFIWLRKCFNHRVDDSRYQRLTFALFGVATPAQLIRDTRRTPFNIGQSIELKGFQLHEAQPLLQGLADRVDSCQSILDAILSWTGGQPFLSQKICQIICQRNDQIQEGDEKTYIEQLIRSQILENWETRDEPEHLKTIRDRLLSSSASTKPILELYQQLLAQIPVPVDHSPEQMELLLSGLVIKQGNQLVIANRIYAAIFNQAWVTKAMASVTL